MVWSDVFRWMQNAVSRPLRTGVPISADSLFLLLAPVGHVLVVVKTVNSLCSFFDKVMDIFQVIITLPDDVEKSIAFTYMRKPVGQKANSTLHMCGRPVHGLFTSLSIWGTAAPAQEPPYPSHRSRELE